MSLKKCTENECKVCTYVPECLGTWREQVKNCGGTSCDLYPVRPLPVGVSHKELPSRRTAVNAHCKACIYDEGDVNAKGSWRQQVAACKSTECALYSVRPFPKIKSVNI